MTNATWKQHPGSSDYNTGDNWTGNTVPDVKAIFGASSQHALTFSSDDTSIGSWTLNNDAPAYTFFLDEDQELVFTGAGIVIEHGSATITDHWFIFFENASSAGHAHFIVDHWLQFDDTSSAGSATITDNTQVFFEALTTAGKAHISVNDDSVLGFEATSKAGSATIMDKPGGEVDFTTNSSAEHAHVTVDDGAVLAFFDSGSAGSAVIDNLGGEVEFNGGNAGSATITNDSALGFYDASDGGDATITTNKGATTYFEGQSTADNAKLITQANGAVDFSNSSGPANDHHVSAGSIQGAGVYALGGDELTLTSNRSTKVTGLIADGGTDGGTGASIVKDGTGTLTLANPNGNLYSGGTLIHSGTLNLATLDAAGSGDIAFDTEVGKKTLKIQNPALSHHSFGNVIDSYLIGDTIDLSGLAFKAGAHAVQTLLANGDFQLAVKSGGVTDTLTLLDPGDGVIKVKNDGHGGTELVKTGDSEKPHAAVTASDDSSRDFQLDSDHAVIHHDFILG